MSNREARRIDIQLSDLIEVRAVRCCAWAHCVPQFFNNSDIADRVSGNTVRYVSIFKQAIDEVIPSSTVQSEPVDVADVLFMQRRAQLEEQREAVRVPCYITL